jgi:hypothetical protein
MGAHETSLNNAILVFKYGFGLFFCGLGLFLVNGQHPYATGLVCLGFFILGAFFLSVTRVRLEAQKLNIGDGFAGTRCRIQKSENAVSLGYTATSGRINSLCRHNRLHELPGLPRRL